MGQLLDEAVRGDAIRPVLDEKVVAGLLDEHRAGRADHSELLWGVLNLSLWRAQFGC
jgi:hypothetical protein